MLRAGVTTLATHDHAFWVYDSDARYREVVTAYLKAGLDRNERVMFLGSPAGREAAAAEYLRDAGLDVDRLRADGRVVLGTAEHEYLIGDRFDVAERIAAYQARVEHAVRDGFAGLRMIGEESWLRTRPDVRDMWVEYELRADLLAATAPITALCAYDRREWEPGELALIEAVHSATMGPYPISTGFRVYGRRGGGVTVRGEVDATCASKVEGLLRTAVAAGTTKMDITRLEFVDVAGIRAIASAGDGMFHRNGQATIRGASPTFARLWTLGAFDRDYPEIAVE